MIKFLRLALSAISIGLLLAGYLASQIAAMEGSFATYAQRVDEAPIRTLALIILLAAILSGFFPSKEDAL
jgi:hypothetical protein